MSAFGKVILLGGAAFGVYELFVRPRMEAAAAAVSATPNQAGLVPATTPAPVPVGNPLTTAGLVQSAASKDGFTFGNVYQWDYYYKQVRGVDAQLADTLPEEVRLKNLTFDEWWTIAKANGLAGYRGGLRGFGRGVGGYQPANASLAIMELQ